MEPEAQPEAKVSAEQAASAVVSQWILAGIQADGPAGLQAQVSLTSGCRRKTSLCTQSYASRQSNRGQSQTKSCFPRSCPRKSRHCLASLTDSLQVKGNFAGSAIWQMHGSEPVPGQVGGISRSRKESSTNCSECASHDPLLYPQGR